MRLLLATNNPGKAQEIRAILNLPGLELVTPRELGKEFNPLEGGATFEENARIKAQSAFAQFGIPALADDSGLEVDALDGLPGIHSARFLGESSDYQKKYREVLRRMTGAPEPRRTARFRCCAALVESGESVRLFLGVCEGKIALEPRGTGGFGYDPVFVPDGYAVTFAELPSEIKNRISHRARAFAQVREYLRELTADGHAKVSES
jgi:XTP/dITP diphosphohydrolase